MNETSEETAFLTVGEVARLLRVPTETVSRLLRDKKLPGIYTGNRNGWRVRRSDLAKWTTNQTKEPANE